MTNVRRRLAAAAAAALALALVAPAAAAPPRPADQQARETARSFGQQGYQRFEAGDFEAAIDLFRKAEEHFHAPTHWLFIARAEAKLGRLFHAERSYKRVLADDLGEGAPKAFVEAQASARRELDALRERIPQVSIDVTGAPEGVTPEITLDGAPLAAGPRGARARVDPGRHLVRVIAEGMAPVEQEVEVAEGDDRQVAVELQPVDASPSFLPAAVAFGLGTVGLGVGAVTGALSLSRVGDLERSCPDRRCTPAEASIADDARALGTASTIGFIAGGVLTAAGVTLLVLRPSFGSGSARNAGVRLTARATPGGVLVRGQF